MAQTDNRSAPRGKATAADFASIIPNSERSLPILTIPEWPAPLSAPWLRRAFTLSLAAAAQSHSGTESGERRAKLTPDVIDCKTGFRPLGRQLVCGKSMLCEAGHRRDAGASGLFRQPRRQRCGDGGRRPRPAHLQRTAGDGLATKGTDRRHEPNRAADGNPATLASGLTRGTNPRRTDLG